MKKTPIFIFSLILLIIFYDVWVIINYGAQESISAYVIEWSYSMPAFSFLTGFVMGHLFWRMKKNKRTEDIDK